MRDGTTIRSCLYFGSVCHTRLRPFRHRLGFRVFSLYIDLDEVPDLSQRLRFFSHNGWNLFTFLDRDHGPRDGQALRPWIDRQLAEAGIDLQGGAVRLLCFPRLLGYVFNPLSIWFCHQRDGRLAAVLYEVHNTFGEQHCYLIPLDSPHQPGTSIQHSCTKRFYVSPFIDMRSTYHFHLDAPDDRLKVVIRQWDPEGEVLVASQTGRRQRLNDASLLRTFIAFPLMTLKVMAGIHWHAFRLWHKGAKLVARPPAPKHAVTLVPRRLDHAAE